MGEHQDLSAMVGFVSQHVAQHFDSDGPRGSECVAAKERGMAGRTVKRLREHFGAAGGALRQPLPGLKWCAMGAVEQRGNLEMRGRKPDPFAADVVHVGKDGRDGTNFSGRFRRPGSRVEVLDHVLIHAVVRGEHPRRGWTELSVKPSRRRGHGSLLPGEIIRFPCPRGGFAVH